MVTGVQHKCNILLLSQVNSRIENVTRRTPRSTQNVTCFFLVLLLLLLLLPVVPLRLLLIRRRLPRLYDSLTAPTVLIFLRPTLPRYDFLLTTVVLVGHAFSAKLLKPPSSVHRFTSDNYGSLYSRATAKRTDLLNTSQLPPPAKEPAEPTMEAAATGVDSYVDPVVAAKTPAVAEIRRRLGMAARAATAAAVVVLAVSTSNTSSTCSSSRSSNDDSNSHPRCGINAAAAVLHAHSSCIHIQTYLEYHHSGRVLLRRGFCVAQAGPSPAFDAALQRLLGDCLCVRHSTQRRSPRPPEHAVPRRLAGESANQRVVRVGLWVGVGVVAVVVAAAPAAAASVVVVDADRSRPQGVRVRAVDSVCVLRRSTAVHQRGQAQRPRHSPAAPFLCPRTRSCRCRRLPAPSPQSCTWHGGSPSRRCCPRRRWHRLDTCRANRVPSHIVDTRWTTTIVIVLDRHQCYLYGVVVVEPPP